MSEVFDKLVALARAVVNRVTSEPAVVLGVAVAAINTATDQTWQGYAAAVGAALLRFFVSPVIDKR